jgi:hypothetical protein
MQQRLLHVDDPKFIELSNKMKELSSKLEIPKNIQDVMNK